MVADYGSPITVRGDGNIVAGRDVNVGSTTFSIDQVPSAFQREFQTLEKYVRSSDSAEARRARIRTFAQDMTISGFGAASGAIVAHLLDLI